MRKVGQSEKMVLISVHVTRQMLKELDELVKRGTFPSRSEAIRTAIYNLVRAFNTETESTSISTSNKELYRGR